MQETIDCTAKVR